jgi:methyl coenzyme M reductase alpha subunit
VQSTLWDPFDRTSRTFLTGGWDGMARLYEIEGTHTTKRIEKRWDYFFYHPIISMDISSQRVLFVGLSTGQIGAVDIKNVNNVAMLGNHDSTICKVIWI